MSLPISSSARPGSVSDSLDEATIRAVVDDFYGRVREDEVIGPVFNAHVADWDVHLPKMYGFWATVLLGEQRYHGNPVEKHRAVSEIRPAHFARWLDLFDQTLKDHCTPKDAEAWSAAARRMGFAMSHRLDHGQNEELLP